MNPYSTRRGFNPLRFILDLLIILIFMLIADHAMRANLERVWRYVPLIVNVGGALIGLIVIWLLRRLGASWL